MLANITCSHQVSDGALRCFASLADRFTRRAVDPAPLAEHGLTNELLERLASAAAVPDKGSGGGGATPDSKSNNPSVSTIVSLLSTLCRGSPSVTHVSSAQLSAIDIIIYYVITSLFVGTWSLNVVGSLVESLFWVFHYYYHVIIVTICFGSWLGPVFA